MRKLRIEIWNWYTHKKYGIKMQITSATRNRIYLWDRYMNFKWSGSIRTFKKAFKNNA